MLLELSQSGGPIILAIFVVSLCAWLLTLVSWWRFQQDFAGTKTRAPVTRRLVLVARELSAVGRRRFKRALYPYLASEFVGLRSNLRVIATLAATAPLLGLLGTVVGMMEAFAALRSSSSTSNASTDMVALSDAISSALLTTQAGLVVALPIVLAHRMLASRLRRQSALLEATLERLGHETFAPLNPNGGGLWKA